jgi:hypothetical protein
MTLPVLPNKELEIIDPQKLAEIDLTDEVHLLDTAVAGMCFRCDPLMVASSLNKGDELQLVREPDNKFDSMAIKVMLDGVHIGYLPRKDNKVISNLMDAGRHITCEVSDVKTYVDDAEILIKVSMRDV